MSTPEGKVKARVKTLLKQRGAYWHMPVQNGMGAPALDFHVCHRGRYAGVETKAPGKKPTARQTLTANEIAAAGGAIFFIDGDEGLKELATWMEGIESESLSGPQEGSAAL